MFRYRSLATVLQSCDWCEACVQRNWTRTSSFELFRYRELAMDDAPLLKAKLGPSISEIEVRTKYQAVRTDFSSTLTVLQTSITADPKDIPPYATRHDQVALRGPGRLHAGEDQGQRATCYLGRDRRDGRGHRGDLEGLPWRAQANTRSCQQSAGEMLLRGVRAALRQPLPPLGRQ